MPIQSRQPKHRNRTTLAKIPNFPASSAYFAAFLLSPLFPSLPPKTSQPPHHDYQKHPRPSSPPKHRFPCRCIRFFSFCPDVQVRCTSGTPQNDALAEPPVEQFVGEAADNALFSSCSLRPPLPCVILLLCCFCCFVAFVAFVSFVAFAASASCASVRPRCHARPAASHGASKGATERTRKSNADAQQIGTKQHRPAATPHRWEPGTAAIVPERPLRPPRPAPLLPPATQPALARLLRRLHRGEQ